MAKDRRCTYNVLKNPRPDGPYGKIRKRRCNKPAVCEIHYESEGMWGSQSADVVVCAFHEATACFEDMPRTRYRRPKKAPTVE